MPLCFYFFFIIQMVLNELLELKVGAKKEGEVSDKICATYILLHLCPSVLFWAFSGMFQSLLEWKTMPLVTNSHVFVLNHPSFPRSPSNSILKMKYSFLKPNLISELPELQSLSVHGIHKIR